MQLIERKYEDFDDLQFEVDLSDYGKDNTDVDDIIFSVKDDLTTADNIIFVKKESLGEISFSGTTLLTVLVQWDETEYGNFTIGHEYKAGLFIKFTGDPLADEHVDQTFKLRINQDFIRA